MLPQAHDARHPGHRVTRVNEKNNDTARPNFDRDLSGRADQSNPGVWRIAAGNAAAHAGARAFHCHAAGWAGGHNPDTADAWIELAQDRPTLDLAAAWRGGAGRAARR